MIELNNKQTPIEELEMPKDIKEKFDNYFFNVPFIKSLVDPNRKRAKDLPRDEDGKIIVDLEHPHILENMDYFRKAAITYEKTGKYTELKPNKNPNSEYYKWVKEEIRRCHEGLIRPSDGEWIPGLLYFYWNYSEMQMPVKVQMGKKKTKSTLRMYKMPQVWDGTYWWYHYKHQAREEGLHCCMLSSRGRGKAHPYSEFVYTPKGLKQWKDISIGDSLFGDDGNITQVTNIPFDNVCDIYEIELANGEKVKCSDGHLWKVRSHCLRKEVVIDTLELLDRYKRVRKISQKNPYGREFDCTILNHNGVNYPYKQTKIDPYTFGLLLGDGCFRLPTTDSKAAFTASDEDWKFYEKLIPYNFKKYKTKYAYNIIIPNFGNILKEYGLFYKTSDEKFIPDEYKFNSIEVRLAVLKGLLDSDGTVKKEGSFEIALTSKRLIEDIRFILASLGISYSKVSVKHTFYYKNGVKRVCKDAYRMRIFSNISLVNLPRKQEIFNNRHLTNTLLSRIEGVKIINIKHIGKEQAKCVTVDNTSHCYLINNFIKTHNSFNAASDLTKIFKLGETKYNNRGCTCYITASDKKFLVAGDQTLDKFQHNIDFISQKTEWPGREMLTNRLQDMLWIAGYKDLDLGNKGTGNAVVGISSNNDVQKLRGTRAVMYILEEGGTFGNLDKVWNNTLPSVEQGQGDERDVFGQIIMFGTAGDKDSDFASMGKMMYHPEGYHIKALNNIYDLEGKGARKFSYFFPAYLNNAGCYDKDGNSDVTKALYQILKDRDNIKRKSGDVNAVVKRTAEYPIVPQEAIMRVGDNRFPIAEINERITQLEDNEHEWDDTLVGTLEQKPDGSVAFKPTSANVIYDYPLKDNKSEGALQIFKLPENDTNGRAQSDRYVIGHDPVNQDDAESLSLSSTFVIDMYTNSIVAEYTGRKQYQDDSFELLRLLGIFYNAQILYESNNKMCYAYFSKMNCTYMLADTPEYLRERDIVKNTGFGNSAKGISATAMMNKHEDDLIEQWLLAPKVIYEKTPDGEEIAVTIHNVKTVRNLALLKELSAYGPDINTDRVRALGVTLVLKNSYDVKYGGDIQSQNNSDEYDVFEDVFFKRNGIA